MLGFAILKPVSNITLPYCKTREDPFNDPIEMWSSKNLKNHWERNFEDDMEEDGQMNHVNEFEDARNHIEDLSKTQSINFSSAIFGVITAIIALNRA